MGWNARVDLTATMASSMILLRWFFQAEQKVATPGALRRVPLRH